jgi:uncharacterized protein with ACT and thioredoxin-like domain
MACYGRLYGVFVIASMTLASQFATTISITACLQSSPRIKRVVHRRISIGTMSIKSAWGNEKAESVKKLCDVLIDAGSLMCQKVKWNSIQCKRQSTVVIYSCNTLSSISYLNTLCNQQNVYPNR